MADINNPQPYCSYDLDQTKKLHVCSQTILRGCVICSALGASWVMLTAKQSMVIFGIPFDARYSYSPAFKYFAFANAIVSAFSLISLFFLFISTRQQYQHPLPNYYYILFLHDLLMMGLVLSGCAAATAIGYVGRFGNDHTGWSPICDHFGKFCNRVTTSISLSYVAVLCLLILTILSATATATATSKSKSKSTASAAAANGH